MTRSTETRHMHSVVVGGGMMGARHARALLSREDVGSLALVEPNRERCEALVRQYGRLRTYNRLADVLASEEIDFAVVAVPIGLAAETISVLLEQEIPVLAEKPLATSADDAYALAQLANRKQTLLSVGYVERFNPAVQALREELESGAGGAVYHVHARRLSQFPYRSGMAGVAIDVATHDLDVLRFIVGARPIRVYAETDVLQGGAAEDLLCASLRYENGVTGLVESNWLTPTKVRRLTVTTEKGMYDVDYLTQDLWLYERPTTGEPGWETLGVMRGANEGRMIRFGLERREPLIVEHEQFVEAVLSGGPAPVSAEDAAETLMVAEAILESGQTNQSVQPRTLANR